MTLDSVDTYGTSLICDVLTAYRRDLERTPDVVQFGEHDADWLRFALRVERVASLAPARPRRGSAAARHPILRPSRLLAATERMEAAGALTLAFTILGAARRVWDTADPSNAGVAVFRQARICRTTGATQAAENFYSFLFSFATRHRLAELRGRALIGRGIIRTLEGDPEAGCRWYAKARLAAGGNSVAIGVSHQAEMVAALMLDEPSRALVSGWRALDSGALGSYDEAGVMVNLASLALRAGRPSAALAMVRRALKRTRHARVRITAFSKGALSAAAMGQNLDVHRFAARIVETAAKATFPIEELEARSELAVAFARVGETTKARRIARQVRQEAVDRSLAAVVRRCDEVLAAHQEPEERLMLSAPARRVIQLLEAA